MLSAEVFTLGARASTNEFRRYADQTVSVRNITDRELLGGHWRRLSEIKGQIKIPSGYDMQFWLCLWVYACAYIPKPLCSAQCNLLHSARVFGRGSHT